VIDRMTRAGIALLIGLGLAWLASSQTRSPSPRAAVSPTPAVPTWALTPGSGPVVASTTPGYGSNLYSIPATTPAGLPTSYAAPTPPTSIASPAVTGPMITATPRRPLAAADCAQNGWQSYTGLGFTSQRGCETWVKRHPPAQARPAAGTGARRPAATPTPH